ncbi:MAG: transposase [Nitrososphaerota archaeon]|jgi:transposase|nr:transposase [Nitrososphaerota archaeon]
MTYTTDLTDTQWKLIEEFFTVTKGKNLQQHNKRDLVNAVLYRNKAGCQWRLLPSDFPNYATVWSFYRRAVKKGVWEKAMDKMVQKVRVDAQIVHQSQAIV